MHVVHLQHRTGLCSAMPGVQHNDHHHPAYALYGVQDWTTLQLTFRVGSEDRTGDAGMLRGAGRARVKLPMSSGRGTDEFSGRPLKEHRMHSSILCTHYRTIIRSRAHPICSI